jgi:hypothetical protein
MNTRFDWFCTLNLMCQDDQIKMSLDGNKKYYLINMFDAAFHNFSVISWWPAGLVYNSNTPYKTQHYFVLSVQLSWITCTSNKPLGVFILELYRENIYSSNIKQYCMLVHITLLSDTDISFGLFNLFTYFAMPFVW